MRRTIARFLNQQGSKRIDAKEFAIGERLYKWAAMVDPGWSAPWYNLGLHTKYKGRWEESYEFNRRAHSLDPSDEAACWNLGIAATALRKWDEARRAWRDYGIDLSNEDAEVRIPPVNACVRLNYESEGEVVWGQRLDPARIAILSVPLPESGHRFNDVVLNDGASQGTRVDESGKEVPVFNELAIWQASEYSTYRAALQPPSEEAIEALADMCMDRRLGIEDWSTIRILCATCSRGNPGPHVCPTAAKRDGSRIFGFGAKSLQDLESVISDWSSQYPSIAGPRIELALPATRH